MSRSYRKPYYRYVCMKDSTVRDIKRMVNRKTPSDYNWVSLICHLVRG